jgi:pilus assembly protein Flp/PilA
MQAALKPIPPIPMPAWRRFLGEAAAATSIEYAVLAAGIALAILTTVGLLGNGVGGLYNGVSSALK